MADSARYGPVARLCAKCEHALGNDFDEVFIMWPKSKPDMHRGHVPSEFCLVDHLPDLSQLHDSAQQGCDFCGFLRGVILSDDTRDRLRSEYKTDIPSLGPSEMKIRVIYTCDERYVNDGSVNDYLVVQVDFGSNIRCDYWNSVNAVEGILDRTTTSANLYANAV